MMPFFITRCNSIDQCGAGGENGDGGADVYAGLEGTVVPVVVVVFIGVQSAELECLRLKSL